MAGGVATVGVHNPPCGSRRVQFIFRHHSGLRRQRRFGPTPSVCREFWRINAR
jgi:hypothetical protein